MKYFLTEQWDNDYNAFIETYIICAKDINEAQRYRCRRIMVRTHVHCETRNQLVYCAVF